MWLQTVTHNSIFCRLVSFLHFLDIIFPQLDSLVEASQRKHFGLTRPPMLAVDCLWSQQIKWNMTCNWILVRIVSANSGKQRDHTAHVWLSPLFVVFLAAFPRNKLCPIKYQETQAAQPLPQQLLGQLWHSCSTVNECGSGSRLGKCFICWSLLLTDLSLTHMWAVSATFCCFRIQTGPPLL